MGKIEMGKEVAFLPANKTLENGETLEVLGVELQFFTEYTSDDYNLTVYVPEKGLVLNNFLWPGTPNIYTLRGGTYRDPLIWRDGLKVSVICNLKSYRIHIPGLLLGKKKQCND